MSTHPVGSVSLENPGTHSGPLASPTLTFEMPGLAFLQAQGERTSVGVGSGRRVHVAFAHVQLEGWQRVSLLGGQCLGETHIPGLASRMNYTFNLNRILSSFHLILLP